MDFLFGEKEEQLRTEIRAFVRDNLPKNYISRISEEEHSDEEWAFSMSISKKLAEKKWLCMHWPKEYGGLDASMWEMAVYKQEVGYWGIPGTLMGMGGVGWVGPSLMKFGTEKQKEKYLPLIASGHEDGLWCTGYSEPDAGSDFANIQTSAQKNGDHYIINGQKVWTSVGHRTRWCWLAARTDPEASRHKGISVIIVDMQSEGVKVRPLPNLIGLHSFNEVFFDNVKVPVENLVGKENNGWHQLMVALGFERGSHVFLVLGNLTRMFDEMINFANKTGLIKKPVIRQKLADLAVDIEALRLLALESTWKMDNNMEAVYEPSRDKAYSDAINENLSVIGTELVGAYSQIESLDNENRWAKVKGALEHYYWMSPGLSIAAGTTDTQKNIIGQFGLKLPKAY